MIDAVTLRPATVPDRPFVKDVYFETQREVIGQLFGRRGAERETWWFNCFYREASTRIILVAGQEAGFVTLLRDAGTTDIQCFFVRSEYQGHRYPLASEDHCQCRYRVAPLNSWDRKDQFRCHTTVRTHGICRY